MTAIGFGHIPLRKLVVVGNRRNGEKLETRTLGCDLYADARTTADDWASQGFGCVVVDMDNRCQVYEMNKWLLQASMQSQDFPPMTGDEYLRFERRRIERDVLDEQNGGKSVSALELRALLQGAELGFPRRSGQTPQDCIADWAWVE